MDSGEAVKPGHAHRIGVAGQHRMRVHSLLRIGIIVLLSTLGMPALARAQAGSAPAPAPAPAIESLKSPAGAGSSEPQITVQGDRLILSWLELSGERATLKFAERTATGWSAPKIVHSSENFFVNSFDVPSVRALADGSLAAHWLETNGPSDDASKIQLAWSKDGVMWSKPASPHHDGTMTEHGFVSLFQSPNAGLGVVWIDGRATDPEKETGDMSLRAAMFDASGKQLSETVVNPRVCECCSTSAAPTPEGVIVAYRGSQRRRHTRHLREPFCRRPLGHANRRAQGRLEAGRLPDQWPGDQRAR